MVRWTYLNAAASLAALQNVRLHLGVDILARANGNVRAAERAVVQLDEIIALAQLGEARGAGVLLVGAVVEAVVFGARVAAEGKEVELLAALMGAMLADAREFHVCVGEWGVVVRGACAAPGAAGKMAETQSRALLSCASACHVHSRQQRAGISFPGKAGAVNAASGRSGVQVKVTVMGRHHAHVQRSERRVTILHKLHLMQVDYIRLHCSHCSRASCRPVRPHRHLRALRSAAIVVR